MFEWINKQGVKSSDGFVLESAHRYYYHYSEGNLRMQINVEPRTLPGGRYHETIRLDSLRRWLPPHGTQAISPEEFERIRQNISSALTFMGIEHDFE